MAVGLTEEELKEVTGFTRPAKQREALAQMQIPFRVRPHGKPFVAVEDLPMAHKPVKRAIPGPSLRFEDAPENSRKT